MYQDLKLTARYFRGLSHTTDTNSPHQQMVHTPACIILYISYSL